jgi:hypothetical protein
MYYRRLITATLLVAGLASGQAPAAHPTNGVLELSATPRPDHDPRPAGKRIEQYVPWHGIVEITIQNISLAPLMIEDTPCDFGFEVFDSAERPIEQTESGKQCAEIFRRIGPPTMVLSSSHHHLAPMQQTVYPVDLSNFFKIEPGHAYTIVIRRSRGLPMVDEIGKPLKEVEVSYSFDVPDYGIPRATRHR